MKRINLIYRSFVLVLYLVVLKNVSPNIRYRFLWYDEAAQFWISKGINTFAYPNTKEGEIIDVITKNRLGTFEPPGFALLLNLWTKFSNDPLWIRVLPFLFFMGVILLVISLSYSIGKQFNVAILMGFIPFLNPTILHMSTEIRPYALEMLGAMVCIYGVNCLKNNLGTKNLLLWSFIFSLFLFSRYSIFIVTFVSSLYVLLLISKESLNKNEIIKKYIFYTLPQLIASYIVIRYNLFYQNPSLGQMNYLPYLNNDISIIFKPINLIYIFFLLISIAGTLIFRRCNFIKETSHLIFIIIFSNILFFVLSLLGFHPWSADNNRSISMILLTLALFILILNKLMSLIYVNSSLKLFSFLSLLGLIFILGIKKNSLVTRYGEYVEMTYLNIEYSKFSKIYVDLWIAPYTRYLFEYGKLKKVQSGYPHNFHLPIDTQEIKPQDRIKLNAKDWKKDIPEMNTLLDYDLVVGPMVSTKANKSMWKPIQNGSYFYIKK